MKRPAGIGLIPLLIGLLLIPPAVSGHGDEEHREPERVVPSRPAQPLQKNAPGPGHQQEQRSPHTNQSTAASDRPAPDTTSSPESSDRPGRNVDRAAIQRARNTARQAVETGDVRAVWKIGATALMVLGLVMAYWPRVPGDDA